VLPAHQSRQGCLRRPGQIHFLSAYDRFLL
jgi:hypothetical protein